MPRELSLLAPLSGVPVPLDRIPDPVFANKMVGEGISIDPTTSELLAPIDGRVTQIHGAHHALTITTPDGIEVLLHIGLDTVMLKGEGFSPRVTEGDQVRAGQPLISFELDKIGRRARSLLTEIIIANRQVVSLDPASGLVEAGRDVVLRAVLADRADLPTAEMGNKLFTSDEIALPNPAGLHARPAAVLAAKAKAYVADIRILCGAKVANAKSVISIMGLSTKQGDLVRIQCSGDSADIVVRELGALIAEGCGENPEDAPHTAPAVEPAITAPANDQNFPGLSAAPGLVIGQIFQMKKDVFAVDRKGGAPADEMVKFDAALNMGREQIEALKLASPNSTRAKILETHKELLSDPALLEDTYAEIKGGSSAAYAWQQSFTSAAKIFASLDNAILRERAADIRDVGRRVLSQLVEVVRNETEIPVNSILIAEDLAPSELSSLDCSRVKGLCTVGGGVSSHVSIIARSLALPTLVGVDKSVTEISNGTPAVLDSLRGFLRLSPDEATLARVNSEIGSLQERRLADLASADQPALTRDGHRIEVAANIRNAEDAHQAVDKGADGVGLLRTEFLFDDRSEAPSEDEQAEAYHAVAAALGSHRPLVIRTLDAGGDKPLSYVPMPKEDNPFLGIRGIRVGLEQPDLLRSQLRAILRSSLNSNLHIMFPMIASLDELRLAKSILREEEASLGLSVKVGVMIEVPSAAVQADVLAPEVDFFSIGTNDLTQYTLAMDRGHPKLAAKADALHPAVLRMIAMTVKGAHKHGKWVGICGGLASDALAVPILVGLGVDELSVTISDIAAIKAAISRVTRTECEILAQEILTLGTVEDVRARLATFAFETQQLS